MKKRLVAFILVLTMVWSSAAPMGGPAVRAYADEPEQESAEISAGEDEGGASVPDENEAGGTENAEPEADEGAAEAGEPEADDSAGSDEDQTPTDDGAPDDGNDSDARIPESDAAPEGGHKPREAEKPEGNEQSRETGPSGNSEQPREEGTTGNNEQHRNEEPPEGGEQSRKEGTSGNNEQPKKEEIPEGSEQSQGEGPSGNNEQPRNEESPEGSEQSQGEGPSGNNEQPRNEEIPEDGEQSQDAGTPANNEQPRNEEIPEGSEQSPGEGTSGNNEQPRNEESPEDDEQSQDAGTPANNEKSQNEESPEGSEQSQDEEKPEGSEQSQDAGTPANNEQPLDEKTIGTDETEKTEPQESSQETNVDEADGEPSVPMALNLQKAALPAEKTLIVGLASPAANTGSTEPNEAGNDSAAQEEQGPETQPFTMMAIPPVMRGTESDASANQDPAQAPASAPSKGPLTAPAPADTSVIQQKIDAAVSSPVGGRIRIILEKNTVYDGNVNIDKNTYSSVNEVELDVADAGEDGLQADGSTMFTGTMNVLNGIALILKGLGLPGTVKVESGSSLTYFGTRADDGVNVEVNGTGSKAELHTGEGEDSVSVTAQDADTVSIDTGKGGDTVQAALTGTNAEIQTGDGEDTVNLTLTGAGKTATVRTGEEADTVTAAADGGSTLAIETEAGKDSVRADVKGGSTATIETGDGDDTVSADVTAASTATIGTGDGEDTIGINAVGNGETRPEGQTDFVTVNAGSGNDSMIVTGQGTPSQNGGIRVTPGDGSNLIQVDISVADAANAVSVDGGSGSDRIHVTGTLDGTDGTDGTNARASGSAGNIQLRNNNGKTVTLFYDATKIKSVTDNLANKKTVDFLADNVPTNSITDSFTDYIYKGLSDSVTFAKAENAGDLLMTNVIVMPADNKDTVTVGEGKTVTADGLQLILLGRTVQVDGTVRAGLVRLEAEDGTGVGAATVPGNIVGSTEDIPISLLNFSDKASVTVGDKGIIYSESDVLVLSKVEQQGGIITLAPDTGLVNVKIAKATVDVNGKIYAGYTTDGNGQLTPTGTNGSVWMDTQVKTTGGVGETYKESESSAAYEGLPLAISLISVDSIINIGSKAVIRAADSIRIASEAELNIETRADSGFGNIPAAIAASYVIGDVRSTVAGSLTAENNIDVSAEGTMKVTTLAEKGKSEGHNSHAASGYASLAIALQDVKAEVVAGAALTAGKDVTIQSDAVEKVYTTATSAAADASTDPNPVETAYNYLKGLWESIKEILHLDTETQEELDDAVSKVTTGGAPEGEAVQVDDKAGQHGQVTVTTGENNQVTVSVTAAEGYRVKSVQVRGLNAGEAGYKPAETLTPDAEGKFTFTKGTTYATVFVEYEEDPDYQPDGAAAEPGADAFNDEQDATTNSAINVREMIGRLTEGLQDDREDVPAENRTIGLSLPAGGDGSSGAVLTYYTEENGASLTRVAPEQRVRLVVNPAEGKALQQNGLTATYKVNENDQLTEKTITIQPDEKGRYILVVPENADPTAGITISAAYVDAVSAGEVVSQAQGMQLAGAVALSVTRNNNLAVIGEAKNGMDAASVTADGDVTVRAEAGAEVQTIADGTAVTAGTGTEGADTNLGAALAVTVADSHNKAEIRGKAAGGGDIRVQAFGEGNTLTESKAGYSKGATGVGGAISVQTARMDSKARLYQGSYVQLDGKLTVEAENDVGYSTDADASGSTRTAKNMGVGAGIAVAIDTVKTVAAVQDNAILQNKTSDKNISGITIRADQQVKDSVTAAAGAASTGISLAAAVAVDVINTGATAYLGHTGGTLNVAGDVKITASDTAAHFVQTNGAAAGREGGYGISGGVSLVSDAAVAQLNQNLTAEALRVQAETESDVRNINIASAKGARIPFSLKLRENRWLLLLDAILELEVLAGDIPEGPVKFFRKYRPPTVLVNKSSMGIVGAVGYNLHESETLAEVMDQANLTIGGRAQMIARNRTEAVLKADSSTTGAVMGIGAGLAYNAVTMHNTARIGNGNVTAGALEVSAVTKEKTTPMTVTVRGITAYDKTSLKDQFQQSFGDYVQDLGREIGLSDFLPGNVVNQVLAPAGEGILDEFIGASGIEEFFDNDFVNDIISTIQENGKIEKWIGIGILALVLETDAVTFEDFGDGSFEQIRSKFVDKFNNMLFGGIRDAVINQVIHGKFRFAELPEEIYDNIKQFVKDNLKDTLKEAKNAALNDLYAEGAAAIKDKTGKEIPRETLETIVDGTIDLISSTKDLYDVISDMDSDPAAKVRQQAEKQDIPLDAPFAVIFDETVGKAMDKIQKLGEGAENPDYDVHAELTQRIVQAAANQNVALSDEQIAVLKNPRDLALEGTKGSSGSHRIDTQAISGAGAHDIGISGSAALTSLDFSTTAELGRDRIIVNPDDKKYKVDPNDDKYQVDIKDYQNDDGDWISEEHRQNYAEAISAAKAAYASDVTNKQKQLEQDQAEAAAQNKAHNGGTVNVTGDMRVEADGSRLLNNVASAALNGKGGASANAASGDAANADVGDSNSAQTVTKGENFTVTATKGARAQIDGSDSKKVWVTLDPGFHLDADEGDSYAVCSYNDGQSGTEKTKKIKIEKDAEGKLYFNASVQDAPADAELHFTLETAETLQQVNLSAPTAGEGVTIPEGTVTADVRGRKPDESNQLFARAGDTIRVAVQKLDGVQLEYIDYTYTGTDGNTHTFSVNPATASADKKAAYALVTADGDQYVFSLRVPEDVNSPITIATSFIAAEEGSGPYYSVKNTQVNQFGRSTGLGVSLAMVTGSDETTAHISDRYRKDGDTSTDPDGVNVGALTVSGRADHREEIFSAAGSNDASIKSMDASVALNLLDTGVKATMAKDNQTSVNGYSISGAAEPTPGDVSVTATENSITNVTASAFSVGRSVAVGATTALNLGRSDAEAAVGGITATGAVTVAAGSYSRDTTTAVATAVGQDISFLADKAGLIPDEDNPGQVKKQDGSAPAGEGDELTDRLNSNRQENGGQDWSDRGEDADSSLPISVNALKSQGVTTDVDGDDPDAMDLLNGVASVLVMGGSAYNTVNSFFYGSKLELAAAIALTQAKHTAAAKVEGDITTNGGPVSVTADNNANFAAVGTSASMSFLLLTNTISGAAAVADNKNEATVTVNGNLTAAGDVTLRSSMVQNLDKDFINKLAVQSVSGAASGSGGTASLGMAVSVIKTKSKTTTDVNGNITGTGGHITVEAADQSRLAARAGGVSLSMGTTIGAGLSNSTILSQSTVRAKVAAKTIAGSGFTLKAERKNVTEEDYANAIAALNMRGEDDSPQINIRTEEEDPEDDKQKNSAQMGLYASKLLNLYDKINQYSFQNYYAESIGASAQLSTAAAVSLGGSFTYLKSKNTVEAALGDGVRVELSQGSGEGKSGDMTLSAADNATARMVTGGLSVAPATMSAGLALALMTNQDTVSAVTGKNVMANTAGKALQQASSEIKTEVLTAGVSLSASLTNKPQQYEESETDVHGNPVRGKPKGKPDPRIGIAISGSVNALLSKAAVRSEAGEGTQVTSGGDAGITSALKADLLALGADSSITVGKSGFAGGGSANGIRDEASAETVLGQGVKIKAGGKAQAGADATSQLIAGVVSQIAQATASGLGIAAGVNVNFAGAKAETTLGDNTVIQSTGDTDIHANADAWTLSASASLSGAVGTAAGASFNMNTFHRTAKVNIGAGSMVDAGGNVRVQAGENDRSYLAGLVLGGSVTGLSLSGNALVMREENDIGIHARGTVKGGGHVLFESWLRDKTMAMDGTVALANAAAAVGLTNVYIEKSNKIQTLLDGMTVTAGGAGSSIETHFGKAITGVYAGSNVRDYQAIAAASVALAGSAGVTGGGVELENNNQVLTRTDTSVLTATAGDAAVKATDHTEQQLLAGGVNFGLSAGIGAALTLLRASKQVEAAAGSIQAAGDILVLAENQDKLEQLTVSAGGSTGGATVEIGAAVQLLKSSVKASLAGQAESTKGSISVNANNDATIYNMAGTVAASAAGVAATPVAVVTLFTGTADARILKDTKVKAAGNVTVHAQSNKDINQYTIGASGSLGFGLSGALNLLISKDGAKAVTESGSEIAAAKDLIIEAEGSYELKSRSAAVSAGTFAVAVNAVVNLLKSNVTAELGGTAEAKGGTVKVNAGAAHSVSNIVANIAAGEEAAGITALVLATGTKMSQDAAEMLAYGNANNKNEKTFDYEKVAGLTENYKRPVTVDGKENGFSDEDLKAAGGDLEDDGHSMSKEGVGTATDDGNGKRTGSIDVTSGYLSKDFDDGKYDDEGEKMRGEDQEATDSADVQNIKKINTYTYDGDPSDAVIARITRDAVIREAVGVYVTANQEITADLVGVSIGAGEVGAGISLAAAKLHSNVSASSLGDLQKIGEKGVTVAANSKAGNPGEEAATRDEAIGKLTDAVDPSSNGIRAVGGAIGAGSAGIAVSLAAALTDNITEAMLGGQVNAGGNVSVTAGHNYGGVKALTLAAAGGTFAAAGSAAIVQSQGTVAAEIIGNTRVKGKNVTVATDATADQTALTTTASAGLLSVNAGLALAINRLTQNTRVRGGADITADSLEVKGRSTATANSYLIGFTVSADVFSPAVLLSAAVSQVNTKVNTEVGEKDKDQVKLALKGDLNIHNEVTGTAIPLMLTVSAGGVAIGGNVLLALNETEALAKLSNADLTASNASVTSDLAGTVSASMASLNAGIGAIGLSINYADIQAKNQAVFENSRAILTKNLTVRTGAGQESNHTEAVAKTISANIGLLAAGLNAAVARNRTANEAILDSDQEISIGGDLTVHGHGVNSVSADVTGLSLGAATAVTGTAVVSMNDAKSTTRVKTEQMTVKHAAAFDATQNAATQAHALTGSGSLITVTGNVVLAYGRTQSVIDVDLGTKSSFAGAQLQARNSAADKTRSGIENATVAGVATGAMIGGAYSQDFFDTKIRFGGDFQAGNIAVETGYNLTTDTDVTPSLGGIRVNAADLAVNLALAKNTAYAGAQLYAAGGNATVGSVDVKAGGSAVTNAIVRSAKVTVSGVALGVNIARAEGSMKQAADLELDQATMNAKAVGVRSVSRTAQTTATVGMTGGASKDEFDVELVNVDVNRARARENLDSTAMIRGGSSASSVLNADSLDVITGMEDNQKTKAEAVTSVGVEIGLATGSGLDSRATTGDSFNSVLSALTANVAGKSNISAVNSTTVRAEGTAPGNYSAADVNVSRIYAGVGSNEDNQTAMVLIGDDTVLNGGDAVNLKAENNGYAETDFVKKTDFTLVGVKTASIPTESWYSTGVLVGGNAKLTANNGDLNLNSISAAGAKSTIDASSLGLAFDYNSMKGSNSITDRNSIDIGAGTTLLAQTGDLNIQGITNTRAQAMSKLKGAGVIAGEVVDAQNTVDREGTVYLDRNSVLQTRNGQVNITSVSGEGDNIVADSYVKAGGLVAIGKATATNNISSLNQITMDQGVQIFSAKDMTILASATSRLAQDDTNNLEEGTPDDDDPLPVNGQEEPDPSSVDKDEAQKAMDAHTAEQKARQQQITDESEAARKESGQNPETQNARVQADDSQGYGIYSHATVKAKGAGVKPNASAGNNLNLISAIYINKAESGDKPVQVQMQSDRGAIRMVVNNAGMRTKAETEADGSALGGWSDAWSEINATLQNTIWVDYATLQSRSGGIALLAENGRDDKMPYLYTKADATSSALIGSADANAVITGKSHNQVRSSNRQSVAVRGEFTHIAVHPADAIHYTLDTHYKTIASSGSDGENFAWGAAKKRCDFCEEGQGATDDRTAVRVDQKAAFENALTPLNLIEAMYERTAAQADKKATYKKALSPLNDIQTTAARTNGITKARYGDEDYIAAGKLFVLDLQVLLEKDVRLEEENLKKYRLWTNGRTFQEVLLLPNSTRLYANTGYQIEYVADVLYGDVLDDGENRYVDIITALTERAFSNPVIPIGSTGSLDMKTGELILPSMADYELYMHEVSAAWMKKHVNEGFISLLSANQDEINTVALEDGGTLPMGAVMGGMTEDGQEDGWIRYWLGITPETAPDGDTPLYYLLVNEKTDEMKAFRTSVNMLAEGAASVAESMYLYRDSQSDMNGEEKYHCMMFDTPEGQKSIIKIVTNILEEREIILPLAFRITLRSFTLEGADLPAYSLGDHLFAMNDGTDGVVSVLDGNYRATFDGDTFESDYVRIENLRENQPVVTIRKGQEIWAENAGENRAVDLAGNEYIHVDSLWYFADEAPQVSAESRDDAA